MKDRQDTCRPLPIRFTTSQRIRPESLRDSLTESSDIPVVDTGFKESSEQGVMQRG